MSIRPVVRGTAVVAASLLTTAALAGPAAADTRTFSDKGHHVTTVTVKHRSTTVTVDAKVGYVTLGSYYTFWFDTDPADPGPEYKTTIYPNSDGIALRRVETFRSSGTTLRCDMRAKADAYGNDHVIVKVPRTCLGHPSKVRVSIRASYGGKMPTFIDWAPGQRRFFGWVHR